MKKLVALIALIGAFSLIGCKPVRVDPLVSIESNETAFVIPLEGNTKAQGAFDSVDFLNEAKVATKRITVPQRWRKTGRFYFSGEWIPNVKVITVDRSPVTREWTDSGEKARDQAKAVSVESKDSIGFQIGVNTTAMVEEPNTAKFLYYYPRKSLASVIDSNVRGDIQSLLSEEFGSRDLEQCKEDKNEIFAKVREKIVKKYESFGITITSFGLAEGLTYEDREIQQAINDAYVAEMEIQRAEQQKLSQIQENERLLSIAQNERKQAEEFEKAAEARKKQVSVEVERMRAEALLNFSTKWNGEVPKFVTVGGGQQNPFLFNMNAK